MSGHIGCFLYAKLIRDIICLLAGGGLIYSIMRWRHLILFPIVWPFARLVTLNTIDGGVVREFEAREWFNKLSKGGIIVVLSLCGIWIIGVLSYVIWIFLKCVYHLYVVC